MNVDSVRIARDSIDLTTIIHLSDFSLICHIQQFKQQIICGPYPLAIPVKAGIPGRQFDSLPFHNPSLARNFMLLK